MEVADDLARLKDSVGAAIADTQRQLDNIGPNLLLAALLSLVAAIGLQWTLDLLVLWIPASFILHLIAFHMSLIGRYWAFVVFVGLARSSPDTAFKDYDELTPVHQALGMETNSKRRGPFVLAGIAIFAVTLAVLILTKAGVLESRQEFPFWPPLVVAVVLILFLATDHVVRSRMTPLHADRLRERIGEEIEMTQSNPRLAACFGFIPVYVVMALPYVPLAIWAVVATRSLFTTDSEGLAILVVLLLQVVVFMLFASYLSYVYARSYLSTSVANLGNVDSRVRQLMNLGEGTGEDIAVLEGLYYEATKQRFSHNVLLGLFPMYTPVLNEAYVKAKTRTVGAPSQDQSS